MPVILCTGYSEKGTESSARELGIKGYALKPLDRKQLAELVRSVLDGEKR
jgi:DNA-binding NarL/FixJ family response regulator